MNPTKCAICKKTIRDFDHYLAIGYGIPLPLYSICDNCGSPVIAFLEEHGLLSFTDQQGISWKANPEGELTEMTDLHRVNSTHRKGKRSG